MSKLSHVVATIVAAAVLSAAPGAVAQVVGACCHGADCTMETQPGCAASGGIYLGDDVECFDGTCQVQADYGVTDLTACWLPDGRIRFTYTMTFSPGNVDTGIADIPVRVTFVAPSGTDSDDQTVTLTNTPAGTCEDRLPPNCTGTCPDWTATFKGNSITLTASCAELSFVDSRGNRYTGCACDYRAPNGKDKSAPDGPEAPYSFTITINPDGVVPERDSSNNSATIAVSPATPTCTGLPATTTIGASVVLAAIVVAGVVVLLSRVRRGRAA